MDNLAFPQLTSGALVQYPLRRRRVLKGTINTFADGSVITSNLNTNVQTIWQLAYKSLNAVDQAALQSHFAACRGPLLAFTFIDPVNNMLADSGSLATSTWLCDPQLTMVSAIDPLGGNQAILLINTGQLSQSLRQTITAPAGYHYCFSLYASASSSASLQLGWQVSSALSRADVFNPGSTWSRLISSGKLDSEATGFTAFITVPAGESVIIWGPQLEPQLAPSRYRSSIRSGVYTNAHFLGDSLTFEAEAPGLYSTVITIETE